MSSRTGSIGPAIAHAFNPASILARVRPKLTTISRASPTNSTARQPVR